MHPPFDGQEFEVWIERITLKLQRKGLWNYCERELTKPSLTDGESKGEECEGHITYKKESRRAKEILYDSMTDKIMKTVKHEATPFRAMEHLKKRYIGKTYFKYASEMTELRKLQLDPKGNMSDHLGEIRRLIMHRIGVLGKPLDYFMRSRPC